MARISPLLASELAELPCPYCGRQVAAGTEWLDAAQTRWGRCGVKLTHAGEVLGVFAFTPTEHRRHAMVKVAWVRPEVVGRGYGRQLIQGASAEMLRLRFDVLLASGGRAHTSCAGLPIGFLERVGFVLPPDSRLWRLDLGQVVLESSGLGVLGRLLRGWGSGPQPAGGVVSGRASRTAR